MPNRWLVTGASGQLGGHVLQQLTRADAAAPILALLGRPAPTAGNTPHCDAQTQQVDLADLAAVRACVLQFRPTHILHLGAMTAVSDCHADPARAERVNVEATRALAEAAAECRARLVFTSTDMVFGGDRAPYREQDPPTPLSVYGRTKAAAEYALAGRDRTLVVRIPLMFGFPVTSRATTFARQIAALRAGQPLRLFVDEFRTPVGLADAARAVIGLARTEVAGVLHVAGPERLSRYDLVVRCAALLGIALHSPAADPQTARALAGHAAGLLVRICRNDVPAPEPRPADLSLADEPLRRHFPHLAPGPLRTGLLTG